MIHMEFYKECPKPVTLQATTQIFNIQLMYQWTSYMALGKILYVL